MNTGSDLCLRVPNEIELLGAGDLVKAEGKNPNSFFFTGETMTPIISEKATIEELTLPKTFLYDIVTEKGKAYTFKIKN